MSPSDLEIRPFTDADTDAVVAIWGAAWRGAMPALAERMGYTAEDDARFFRQRVIPEYRIWVACLEAVVVGHLAMKGDYIQQLYVEVARQRQGIGSALLALAKAQQPQGLRLHTHQANSAACVFYEAHGFHAVERGVSPPPESEPDVMYAWRG